MQRINKKRAQAVRLRHGGRQRPGPHLFEGYTGLLKAASHMVAKVTF
jgi:hypothetical protein